MFSHSDEEYVTQKTDIPGAAADIGHNLMCAIGLLIITVTVLLTDILNIH